MVFSIEDDNKHFGNMDKSINYSSTPCSVDFDRTPAAINNSDVFIGALSSSLIAAASALKDLNNSNSNILMEILSSLKSLSVQVQNLNDKIDIRNRNNLALYDWDPVSPLPHPQNPKEFPLNFPRDKSSLLKIPMSEIIYLCNFYGITVDGGPAGDSNVEPDFVLRTKLYQYLGIHN